MDDFPFACSWAGLITRRLCDPDSSSVADLFLVELSRYEKFLPLEELEDSFSESSAKLLPNSVDGLCRDCRFP